MRKNGVKRILALLLIALMSVTLVACGGAKEPSPSDAVKEQLEAKRSELDTSEIGAFFEEGAEVPEELKAELTTFLERLKGFDFEVTGEKIADDGQSATVDVKITTYDFGKAMSESIGDILGSVFATVFSGGTPDESTVMHEMVKALNAPDKKEYSKTVAIECTKEDDKWIAEIDDNADLMDAVTGGLEAAIEELQDSLNAFADLGAEDYDLDDESTELGFEAEADAESGASAALLAMVGEFDENLVGEYDLTYMESEDEIVAEEDIKLLTDFGMEIGMTIYSDGTGSMVIMGESLEFALDGNSIVVEGEKVPFTFDGTNFTIEEEGALMRYTKK